MSFILPACTHGPVRHHDDHDGASSAPAGSPAPFAADIGLVPGAELVAVGSRSGARARAFAEEYGAAAAYGSYEELVADPDVDVVYIASPHALHLEHARLAFEAGKHVLCEKPLTLSVAEAEEMIALAAQHDRFLMEAMWTACHPVILELRRRLPAGDLGTPRQLHAELGFVVPPDASARMSEPALGASALLDMGIYPLTLAHLMLGEAESIVATADAVGGRHRPRRRDGRPLPGRRAGHHGRLDDLVVLATRRDRHRPGPDRAGGLPPPRRSRRSSRTRRRQRRHRRRPAAQDHRRGAGHRPRLRPRDRRGRPLHRGRLRESPFVTARPDADDHAPDGRRTPPGRRALPDATPGLDPQVADHGLHPAVLGVVRQQAELREDPLGVLLDGTRA